MCKTSLEVQGKEVMYYFDLMRTLKQDIKAAKQKFQTMIWPRPTS